MSEDGEEGRQPRGLRAHDIEQPDLSSEDDMSSSDSNESVEVLALFHSFFDPWPWTGGLAETRTTNREI